MGKGQCRRPRIRLTRILTGELVVVDEVPALVDGVSTIDAARVSGLGVTTLGLGRRRGVVAVTPLPGVAANSIAADGDTTITSRV